MSLSYIVGFIITVATLMMASMVIGSVLEDEKEEIK